MHQIQTYFADAAVHPGQTLIENLDFLCISQVELSERTGLTQKHISSIIKGKASITPETALKLEKVLGIDAAFWNNLEKNYQATIARIEANTEIAAEIELLEEFKETYQELAKCKILPKRTWIAKNFPEITLLLQSFYGVGSMTYLRSSNLSMAYSDAAYRKHKSKNPNQNTIAAWLRLGQIKAQETFVEDFDIKKLSEAIPKIRELCLTEPVDSLQKIKSILSDCGVVLVCAPYLKNTYTQGAVQWVSKNKVVITLKTTHQSSDKFWFNLFHEIAHILKHGKAKTFIDLEDNIESKEEKEADKFAQETLLPQFDKEEIQRYSSLQEGVSKLSSKYKVSNSIIAGRLSHDYKDEPAVYKLLNPFINRFDYCDF